MNLTSTFTLRHGVDRSLDIDLDEARTTATERPVTPAYHAEVLLLRRDRAGVVVLRHGRVGVLLLRHGRIGLVAPWHD